MKPSPVIPYRPKIMKRILASALLVLAGFMAVPVQADVPLRINYQGRVTDSTGALIGDGTPVNRKIIFRIWDHASNSTGRLWTEEQTVTIYNGDFSVLLGAGIDPTGTAASESRPALDTVFAADGTDRFLEIMVDDGNNTIEAGDQPISPRQQITSTGYAFRAKFADNVATGTDLNLNGSNNYGLGWYGTGRQFANTSIDGPVLYGNAGGALGSYNGTTQTSALRWNAAGQVGVGSVDLAGMDATSKMVLQGNEAGAPPKQLTIRGATDTNKRLYLGYNTSSNYGALQAYNGASTATSLLLNPSGGNVGLGSSTPGFPLTFSDTLGDKISLNGQSGNSYGFGIQSSRLQIHTDGVSSDILFGYGSSAALTETMRIKGNGNVGIGTTAPAAKLDVNGDASLGGASSGSHFLVTGNQIQQYSGATPAVMHLNFSGGDVTIRHSTSKLGIGTTTPSQKLDVNGDGLFSGGSVYVGSTATLLSRSAAGKLGAAAGVQFNAGSSGVLIEDSSADGESGGFFVNGNTAAIWNPGDTGKILSFYDEDSFSSGVTPTPLSWIASNGTYALQDSSSYGASAIVAGTMAVGSTSSPTKGKLQVSGYSGTYSLPASNKALTPSGVVTFGAQSPGSVIYADGDIVTSANFVTFSDERIKKVKGRSDGALDLAALLAIEITDFSYIDEMGKGSGMQKKVLAQQVEKAFPLAVTKTVNEIPDIYQTAELEDGWIILDTNLKRGERVLIVQASMGAGGTTRRVCEVVEVAKGKFRIDDKIETDEVFVFGREVDDFRIVDYDAISMLNVSATQQIKKEKDAEVKALQASVSERDEKISALEKRVIELEAKDKARDAKLSAIETLLRSSGKATAQTASLKQGGGAE